jgi:nucleoside-diphosphate kinase
MELTKLTFAMIKPDAVAAKNSGKIIDMIEHNGFEIVRMQKVIIAADLAQEFYAVHKERPFFGELVEFVISAPVIIMALHKDNAINSWRELIGATDPAKAAAGTIRNLYGTDLGKNAVHGSDAPETAVNELEMFFPDLFEYESAEENCSKDKCSDDDDCCNQ